jgi:hypothetical protein
MFDFKMSLKDNYVSLSLLNDLNIKFYDNGYVLFVEGKILNCILFMNSIDILIKVEVFLLVQPKDWMKKLNFYLIEELKLKK